MCAMTKIYLLAVGVELPLPPSGLAAWHILPKAQGHKNVESLVLQGMKNIINNLQYHAFQFKKGHYNPQ